MMRIISQDEKIDVPYELSQLYTGDTQEVLSKYFDNVSEKGRFVISIQMSGSNWTEMAKFNSETDALREMRRIRRAYEAGAKFYIIGTGDHDGPMEV